MQYYGINTRRVAACVYSVAALGRVERVGCIGCSIATQHLQAGSACRASLVANSALCRGS